MVFIMTLTSLQEEQSFLKSDWELWLELRQILEKAGIRNISQLNTYLERNKIMTLDDLNEEVRGTNWSFEIKDEKVNEKASILSGGERVKISLCKIILEDINILILDEITNHLDINSIQVIEEALMNYDRAIIFVSHDKTFINNIADELLIIKDRKINKHLGNYSSYIKSLSKKDDNIDLMLLESKMSEIIGKLSMEIKKEEKEKLNREYDEILKKINTIKKEMN